MTRWRAILAVILADETPRIRARLSPDNVIIGAVITAALGALVRDIIGERRRIEGVRRDVIADLSSRSDEIAERRERMIAGETNATWTDKTW